MIMRYIHPNRVMLVCIFNVCTSLQELGEGSVDSVGLLITLGCWLLDQFVLRRNARIVPKSFAPRPSHVDIHAMEYKEKKNVFHVCVDVRLR